MTVIMLKTMLINLRFKYTKNDLDFHMTYLSFNDTIVNRKCTVYFPTYYPNGDYHLFFDSDWKYGIFGNPWKKEIIVMGKNLIEKFESNKTNLNIN